MEWKQIESDQADNLLDAIREYPTNTHLPNLAAIMMALKLLLLKIDALEEELKLKKCEK